MSTESFQNHLELSEHPKMKAALAQIVADLRKLQEKQVALESKLEDRQLCHSETDQESSLEKLAQRVSSLEQRTTLLDEMFQAEKVATNGMVDKIAHRVEANFDF